MEHSTALKMIQNLNNCTAFETYFCVSIICHLKVVLFLLEFSPFSCPHFYWYTVLGTLLRLNFLCKCKYANAVRHGGGERKVNSAESLRASIFRAEQTSHALL